MKRTFSISEKHLRKFKKINLQPGEFEIMIGNSAKNTRVKKLFLVYRDKKAK